MSNQDDVKDMVKEANKIFGVDEDGPRMVTLRRGARGDFDLSTQKRETEGYSLGPIQVTRSKVTQGLGAGTFGLEDVVFKGEMTDLTADLGPDPQLAAGMTVTEADGTVRRVVRVEAEANGAGFALYCTTERSPKE